MYFLEVRTMREVVGVSPYGGDLNKWPSRLVDAFVLLQDEHSHVEKMMQVHPAQHSTSTPPKPPVKRKR